MKPKSGKAGTPVAPAEPTEVQEADVADPGEMAKIKKEQIERKKGKYGSEKVKPHKPPKAAESSSDDEEDENEDEEEEKKDSWIEIELVGEDDEPIPSKKYKIVLPDDTVAQGTLDQNGWARVEGFDKGDCKISFPDLDQDAWEFIESGGAKEEGAS